MLPIATIQHALKTPSGCFADPKLRRGRVAADAAGRPLALGGAFAVTWRVEVDGEALAVRTPRTPDQESLRRLQAVQSFLGDHPDLPIVPLEVQPDGLLVGGESYPVVIMPWAKGRPLRVEIEKNLRDAGRLRELADDLAAIPLRLEEAGCAHGDLHPGNIFVQRRSVKCIDHGSMYVPALSDLPSIELGHPDYNSPLRSASDFGPRLDRFAASILHTTLRMLADDPTLWETIGPGAREGGEGLLLREEDLRNPDSSPALEMLLGHQLLAVRARARQLRSLLGLPLASIPRPATEPFKLEAPPLPVRREGWVATLVSAAGGRGTSGFPARGHTLPAKEIRS